MLNKSINLRADSVNKKIWFFLNFFMLQLLAWKKNWEPISSMKQLGKIKNRHSWNCFANGSSIWIELVNFKTSELKLLVCKFQTFCKLIQFMNWIETLQSYKNQLFAQKKSNCLRFDSVYKLNYFKILEARKACYKI